MSRIIHRPNQAVDYGTVETNGSGNVLGDNNDSTRKQYYEDSGSILLYPTFDPGVVPTGRSIIAVRAGHKQQNGGSLLVLHNGWVMGYLRINGQRYGKTRAYKQDGYSTSVREVEGEALYNTGFKPWTAADINKMTTDVGAATGEFGPNKKKLWCICNESYIILVIDDDVQVPTINYPPHASTIATSSVDFKGNVVVTQPEQPVACVFQVSRSQYFDDDTVQTFVGGLVQTNGNTSNFDSKVGEDSYTNLGPGRWYVRVKGKDYRGVESPWGDTTYFDIVHAALPVPQVNNPGPDSMKNTPYGYREATFAIDPPGERYVGIEWQFSKVSDFSSGVISWKNNAVGRYNKGPVGYTADPDPSVTPGLHGDKVSTDDPDQYLTQGTWYVRARAVDVWEQTGNWSTPHSFTVSHPPTVQQPWPDAGKAFDDDAFPVRWQFGDAWKGDVQSAYRVVVRDPTNTTVIHDTTKIESPFNTAKVTIPDAWLEQTLNLSIQVWDRDDVASTVWTGTFRHSKAPFITLPYPEPDEAIITGQPNLTWSATFAPGQSQKSYHIAFIRRDTGVIEWKMNTPALSSDMFWNAPSVVLKNVSAYQLALTITDTQDLYTTLLRNFSTDYVRPPQIYCSVFVANYEEDGYVKLLWPATTVDPQFVEYRLYRRNVDIEDATWEQIGTVTDPEQWEFHDWSTSGPYRYQFAITQVVMLYGALVESLPDEYGEIVQVQSSHYWLISPNNEELNTKLYHITDDKYVSKLESSSHDIIGGGTRFNFGKPIGIEGSLSGSIKGGSPVTVKQARERIERIQTEMQWCYLRDPFGNYTKVALGEISIGRIPGVGTSEFVDIEIPYTEVK
ncbi:minor tail protein [Gordonia phage Jormungandr]|uniref:Minor tail protein n=1 Tax=Gordonia phage Jormungandr TaxID=2517931 RepID=A0A482J9U8_9CAUD|nr:minor tail protein [Gordonia phage Jormungandr]